MPTAIAAGINAMNSEPNPPVIGLPMNMFPMALTGPPPPPAAFAAPELALDADWTAAACSSATAAVIKFDIATPASVATSPDEVVTLVVCAALAVVSIPCTARTIAWWAVEAAWYWTVACLKPSIISDQAADIAAPEAPPEALPPKIALTRLASAAFAAIEASEE